MSVHVTMMSRLRRTTLRTRLAAIYAGLLVVVVIIVLVAAAFLFRTVTAPPGVETSATNAQYFAAGAAIVIVLAVLAGSWLAWRAAGLYLRPLRELNATARDISATNIHRRLEFRGPDDEITQLGGTFDDLFDRLESSFESQRRFVANASHELRTPLAGQRTLLQVALADPDASADDLRAACEEALALGERQEQLVDRLLTLASSERGVEHREPLDLAEITKRVLLSRRHNATERGIRIRTTLNTAPTTGDPVLIESMIANLLDNAIQHNLDEGTIDLSTDARADAEFSIGNSGPVISTAHTEQIFQPFQRLGHSRTGSSADHYGLGLAIVNAIADAHHATIAAHPRSTGGIDIRVEFPEQWASP
jgi:signal transduction histidine kinase